MTTPARPVTELHIGGHTYRVQSSAEEAELTRLASLVDARLAQLPAPQRQDPRSLVLVALSLARDLDLEQRAHQSLRARVAERLTSLVGRIDAALDHCDENGNPLPALSTPAPAAAAPTTHEAHSHDNQARDQQAHGEQSHVGGASAAQPNDATAVVRPRRRPSPNEVNSTLGET
jgi:cell division protein ZapA (FtsZ GTPase activity inhibitor)